MKLGNSNGNNKGKKYYMRGRKNNEEPTAENRKKNDSFNQWFTANCQQLINFLISKNTYDADTFGTTYMRISEKLLYTPEVIKDYKAYFHRSYYTNYILDRTKEARYVTLPSHDRLEAHHHNPYERERMQVKLETDVFDYVYQRYELRDFELFKMYVSLKPAINYHTLSEITHVQVHTIQRIISKILMDVRANKSLMNRYKDLK